VDVRLLGDVDASVWQIDGLDRIRGTHGIHLSLILLRLADRSHSFVWLEGQTTYDSRIMSCDGLEIRVAEQIGEVKPRGRVDS